MTFSIEIVKEGFISKKYAFSGRTVNLITRCGVTSNKGQEDPEKYRIVT
jgi:hypothetical protein